MTHLEIRQKFFDFFKKHKHTQVPSSSLIPAEDPTLLFANAGMNQFKDVFLGKEQRSYTRAVSIQKCIRAGGKHNDLENVGFTKRHLTFFEMMGNFSFGDYFKKDAIRFAWDFSTKEVGLSGDKIYASVYRLDDEAYDIWNKDIGLPADRIVRLGESDNFWQMGDTGPCGPCSELYIDRGAEFGCGKKSCAPGCNCDRFLEFWNLVFMQFDRQSDGVDKPLKQTGVDTGMGLERLCAIIQNKDSVFDIDLFSPLLASIEKLTGITYSKAPEKTKAAFKVLVDHIRSSSFAIADGCMPSNEGRGYVLRKIIRRAALFAQKLSDKNIFPDLVYALTNEMGQIYPELKINKDLIVTVLKSETEKFSTNLVHGQAILNKYFEESKDTKIITGQQAFKLYDTYGFPLELTNVISHEHDFKVDTKEFEVYMEKQRMQSGKKTSDEKCHIDESLYTHFTGYEEHLTQSTILGFLVDNNITQEVKAGTACYVLTKHSPFYVECGGQVSDQGYIKVHTTEIPLRGLKKINNAIGAYIETPIDLHAGTGVTLVVDSPSRINTMKNHTATHLLQAALISTLGKHVKQSGSVVQPDYLRFDFTYEQNLTPDQIKLIEEIVNKKILENIPVKISQTTLKDATNKGVIAFFGEKYNPEKVRVVEIPGFSAELCGGTHVTATGDIGIFKITEVSALSAGNRRIVALTGPAALELFQKNFSTIKALSQEFKVPIDDVGEAVKKQKEQLQAMQTQIKNLKKQLYKMQLPHLLQQVHTIKSVPFLLSTIDDATPQDLKDISQDLMKAKPGLYFLASQAAAKSQFVISVSPEYTNAINLQELGTWLQQKNFQGGGKATQLQGSGPVITQPIIDEIKSWLNKNVK